MTLEDTSLFHQHLRQLGMDPENMYQELEMSDRYVQIHQDTSWSNAHVQLHSHVFYEVLCCRSSCGAQYLVGSERYRLQKGDIVFVPPGVSHRPLLPEAMAEPYIRDILWLSTEFIDMMERLFPNPHRQQSSFAGLLRTAGTQWEYLGELLRAGAQEAERQAPGWDVLVMSCAMSFMTHLKRAFLEDASVSLHAETPQLLDKAMAYIEQKLSEKITLEDTSKYLFVSKSTISQVFHDKMGVSFYRCVTQRRLIAAKALISAGIPLEEVGSQVGFSDYSTFYRAFKKEYGIGPRQYRKILNAENGAGR